MILHIFNLGEIDKVSIDLSKPLNVFCGYNNLYTDSIFKIIEYIHNNIRLFPEYDFLQNSLVGDTSIAITKEFLEYFCEEAIRDCTVEQITHNNKDIFLFYGNFRVQLEVTQDDYETFLQTTYQRANIITILITKKENSNLIDFDVKEELSDHELNQLYNKYVRDILMEWYNNQIGRLMIGTDRVWDRGISYAPEHPGQFVSLKKQIESEILHGSIKNDDYYGLIFVFVNNKGEQKHIPMYKAPLHVKVLSGLACDLYEDLVHKGDFVIIQNAEMGLHPQEQIKLAQIIAQMVKGGLRVIMSTNSDFITREFNNLIMWNNLEKWNSHVDEYYPNVSLSQNDIAIKEIYSTNKGYSVQDAILYKDGFSVKSLDEVIKNQNYITELLYDLINEQEDKKENP